MGVWKVTLELRYSLSIVFGPSIRPIGDLASFACCHDLGFTMLFQLAAASSV